MGQGCCHLGGPLATACHTFIVQRFRPKPHGGQGQLVQAGHWLAPSPPYHTGGCVRSRWGRWRARWRSRSTRDFPLVLRVQLPCELPAYRGWGRFTPPGIQIRPAAPCSKLPAAAALCCRPACSSCCSDYLLLLLLGPGH